MIKLFKDIREQRGLDLYISMLGIILFMLVVGGIIILTMALVGCIYIRLT